MASAERTAIPIPGTALSWGRNDMNTASPIEPPSTSEMGRSRSVRRFWGASPAEVSLRSRNDARKLSMMVGIALSEVDDPARGHRPRADVADVPVPDVARATSRR